MPKTEGNTLPRSAAKVEQKPLVQGLGNHFSRHNWVSSQKKVAKHQTKQPDRTGASEIRYPLGI